LRLIHFAVSRHEALELVKGGSRRSHPGFGCGEFLDFCLRLGAECSQLRFSQCDAIYMRFLCIALAAGARSSASSAEAAQLHRAPPLSGARP
jgi:hypothetical protein